jgi:hypothetical protein
LRFAVAIVLFVTLTACTSTPPPVRVPEWDAIPPGLLESLCRRLQSDALATGSVTVVNVTQPLVTQQNMAALAFSTPSRGGTKRPEMPKISINRAIPVQVASGGSCRWTPIDVRDLGRYRDTMVVELSAPLPNPYRPGEAGMFVRASLAQENASWYWLQLLPRGEAWSVGNVSVLFR